jgi:hypothetical protein
MSTRVWSLAVIILGMVLPFGWTGVLVLLVLEWELIRPLLSGGQMLAPWCDTRKWLPIGLNISGRTDDQAILLADVIT